MVSFTEKARSLCIKALDLAKQNLGEGTKEQFISHVMAFLDLLKIEAELPKETKAKVGAIPIQPLSQLFQKPAKAEECIGFVDTLIPDDHPIRALNLPESNDNSQKAFFAAAIFSLIMLMSAAEMKCRNAGVSGDELMRRLDGLSEQLRIIYEQLLYFDSELENIKNRHSKRVGTDKSNAGHTELHRQFFDYYAKNGDKWSRAECARRFYRGLGEDHQRCYTSERHAERQLTEALRNHSAH